MQPILRAEHITKDYVKENILNGISLIIEKDTFTAILGPSGSGKSTLLNILSGMIQPTTGMVWFEDMAVTDYAEAALAVWKRTHVGYVFQDYQLLNNLTAEENIKVGICPNKETLSFDRLIHILELEELLHKFPAQLSGGQKQRVAIARAVIKAPSLLFCDEATGALDEANSKRVIALLHQLKTTFGITILFTTHNVQIARTADRVITIKNGMLAGDRINKLPILANDMVWG